ncbi:MAG: hypothetical protein AAFN70_21775, partial [Planctomycetota bacterium]
MNTQTAPEFNPYATPTAIDQDPRFLEGFNEQPELSDPIAFSGHMNRPLATNVLRMWTLAPWILGAVLLVVAVSCGLASNLLAIPLILILGFIPLFIVTAISYQFDATSRMKELWSLLDGPFSGELNRHGVVYRIRNHELHIPWATVSSRQLRQRDDQHYLLIETLGVLPFVVIPIDAIANQHHDSILRLVMETKSDRELTRLQQKSWWHADLHWFSQEMVPESKTPSNARLDFACDLTRRWRQRIPIASSAALWSGAALGV